MSGNTMGIDHIGITVPDMEEATLFFKEAFEAEFVYDNLKKEDEPRTGEVVEKRFDMESGGKETEIRMITIGNSCSIELFCFENTNQKEPASPVDYGIQHVALYVENMRKAVQKFEQAGGTLRTAPQKLSGEIESGEGNWFVYGKTPWGMTIELITYPAGIQYPENSERKRWTP